MPNDKPKSWRDWLLIHPAADRFPLLPPDELRALAADIKRGGLRQPAVFRRRSSDGEPELLDGRNRLDALELLGEEITLDNGIIFEELPSDIDAVAYIVSVNIHRRHLTTEVRQDLLIELIARAPQKSDRQHGKDIGVDHKTIGRARAKGEDVGRIPHVESRQDTKGRQQPAHKARTAEQAHEWTPDQSKRKALAEEGRCVVANMHDNTDTAIVAWAKATDRLVRIDRITDWGNPFEMPDDGTREEVIANFTNHYLPYKKGLLRRLPDLREKVLGCWCHPEDCHGHVIAEMVNKDAVPPSASPPRRQPRPPSPALVQRIADRAQARADANAAAEPPPAPPSAGAATTETVGPLDERQTVRPGVPNFTVRERAGGAA